MQTSCLTKETCDVMNTLIEAKELTKKFGNKVALNSVSFTINQGDSIALVGPNGAGKSTLMSLICGFLRPTSGGGS